MAQNKTKQITLLLVLFLLFESLSWLVHNRMVLERLNWERKSCGLHRGDWRSSRFLLLLNYLIVSSLGTTNIEKDSSRSSCLHCADDNVTGNNWFKSCTIFISNASRCQTDHELLVSSVGGSKICHHKLCHIKKIKCKQEKMVIYLCIDCVVISLLNYCIQFWHLVFGVLRHWWELQKDLQKLSGF